MREDGGRNRTRRYGRSGRGLAPNDVKAWCSRAAGDRKIRPTTEPIGH
jgi:hypothetical protein